MLTCDVTSFEFINLRCIRYLPTYAYERADMNVFLLMYDLILTASMIPIVYLEGNVCMCLNCLHLSDRGHIVLTGVSRSGVVVPESTGHRFGTVACMDSALLLT